MVSTMAVANIPDSYFAESTLPFLIGYMFNWMLFGVLSVQVYLYYLAFPKDKHLSNILVFGIYALETAQTILLSKDAFALYTYTSVMDTTPGMPLERIVRRTIPVVFTMYAVPVLGGIVAFIVQIFYAYRLFIFTGSRGIFIYISVGALIQLLCAILGGVPQFARIPSYEFFLSTYKGKDTTSIFVPLWGATSAFVDTSIAGLMMFNLFRRDSGWNSTHTLLARLVRLAVGTGAVTTLVAVFYLLFICVAKANYWCIFAIILGKLYSNAMMVNFNHRIEFVGAHMLQPTDMDMYIPSGLFAATENHSSNPRVIRTEM